MASDLYSFQNLWQQYRVCRRNKRNTTNQLRFELDAEANLLDLQHELRDHTYRPGQSICFVTGGPKPLVRSGACLSGRALVP
jgi:RNA-directed DNA polymerase